MSVSDIRNRTEVRAVPWRGSTPPNPEACPDGRALSEYCEGRLSHREKESITSHLVECERCYFGVTESMRIAHESVDDRPAPRRWVTQLASAAALVLTTGALVSFVDRHGQPRPPAADDLVVQAARSPLRTDLSGAELNKTPADAGDARTLNVAASQLAEALRPAIPNIEGAIARTSPRDLGVPRVKTVPVKGKSGLPPGAAALKQPAQNDLARLYLDRWRESKDLEDAIAALQAARRALTEDPEELDARFNMAEALEAMTASLQDEARKAWEQYLSADAISSRAQEVRRRLNASPKPKNFSYVAGGLPRSEGRPK